jgi:hypothetical protein
LRDGLEAVATSQQFKEFIEAILDSDFYEANPSRACLFVPFADLLNENDLNASLVDEYLSKLDFWNSNGRNHFLFNIVPRFGTKLSLKHKAAIITSSQFESDTIRNGFDLTVPIFNPATAFEASNTIEINLRTHFLVSTQTTLTADFLARLKKLNKNNPKKLTIFESCSPPINPAQRCLNNNNQKAHKYTDILSSAKFCLITNQIDRSSSEHFMTSLFDALKFTCIPVLITGESLLPFEEFIDWSLISIQLNSARDLDQNLFSILERFDSLKLTQMARQQSFIFERYFATIAKMSLATFEYLETRLEPASYARTYEKWNFNQELIHKLMPYTPVKSTTFTAVIVARNFWTESS